MSHLEGNLSWQVRKLRTGCSPTSIAPEAQQIARRSDLAKAQPRSGGQFASSQNFESTVHVPQAYRTGTQVPHTRRRHAAHLPQRVVRRSRRRSVCRTLPPMLMAAGHAHLCAVTERRTWHCPAQTCRAGIAGCRGGWAMCRMGCRHCHRRAGYVPRMVPHPHKQVPSCKRGAQSTMRNPIALSCVNCALIA